MKIYKNRFKNNAFSNWNNPINGAAKRLKSGVCVPYSEPRFHIEKGSKVFTIGSCFARNIEESLAISGMDVLSQRISVPYETKSSRKNGIINKYNTHTILDELLWAFDKEEFPPDALVEIEGKFLDPFLKPGEEPQTYESVIDFRKTLREYYKQIIASDLVIITLGMIECWLDNKTNKILNQVPHPKAMRSEPGRYSFVQMEHTDLLSCMRGIIGLLETVGIRKVIITTSPVPLNKTFTAQDIITANCYSKSLLRVVCEDLIAEYPQVDYFPSYETILYGDRSMVWQNDLRHASDYVVQSIMETFLSRYIPEHGSSTDEQREAVMTEESETTKLKKMVDRYKNLLIKNNIEFA